MSIIVPVYNAEKYIEKCITSIINQTLKNIEIIIVNDGSKDNSINIISDIAKADKRIIIINQKNLGVSAARNNGIRVASGDYIGFVDSDDYIELTMFEKMYKKAKADNSDIVVCNVKDVFENSTRTSLDLEDEIISLEDSTIEKFLANAYFKLGTAVWHKLFKATLIKDNNIEFINYSIVSSEDTVFNFQCMVKSKIISSIKEPLYNYIITDTSLTKSNIAKDNMIFRCKNTVEILSDYCEENQIKIGDFINYFTYFQLINSLSYIKPVSKRNLTNAIEEYSNSRFFSKALKSLAFSSKLKKYFISHKNQYNIIYRIFDKLFAFLCYLKLYNMASLLHLIRIKRTQAIQSKA